MKPPARIHHTVLAYALLRQVAAQKLQERFDVVRHVRARAQEEPRKGRLDLLRIVRRRHHALDELDHVEAVEHQVLGGNQVETTEEDLHQVLDELALVRIVELDPHPLAPHHNPRRLKDAVGQEVVDEHAKLDGNGLGQVVKPAPVLVFPAQPHGSDDTVERVALVVVLCGLRRVHQVASAKLPLTGTIPLPKDLQPLGIKHIVVENGHVLHRVVKFDLVRLLVEERRGSVSNRRSHFCAVTESQVYRSPVCSYLLKRERRYMRIYP